MYREVWIMATPTSKWDHIAVDGDKHYRNGLLVEPFDFDREYREAYRAADFCQRTCAPVEIPASRRQR